MANRVVQGLAALVAALGLVGGAQAGDEGCEPGWVEGQFRPIGLNDRIEAMVVFDDGTGPAVYAGGWFTAAHGEPVNYIARWSGSQWQPVVDSNGLGIRPALPGQDFWVDALCVYDDGTGSALYIGGRFFEAGGQQVNNIVRWDGAQWSALGTSQEAGVEGGRVHSLAVFDDGNGPALYVGGSFSAAGGEAARSIARWNGQHWSPVHNSDGLGISGFSVNSMRTFDDGSGPALYVGGSFTAAGGIPTQSVARWDGTSWSALSGSQSTGVNGAVYDIGVFNDGSGPSLFFAGSFRNAGGFVANNIVEWNGTDWIPLTGPSGTGVDFANPVVFGIEGFDAGSGPRLHVAGYFANAGGLPARGLATWDGQEWSVPASSSLDGSGGGFRSLQTLDMEPGPALFAGRAFDSESSVPDLNQVLAWHSETLSVAFVPDDASVGSTVGALASFDDGSGEALYVGGNFRHAGDLRVDRIARWDGEVWSALTSPLGVGLGADSTAVHALHERGGSLYVGGEFSSVGSEGATGIARWDGSAWHALEAVSGENLTGGVVQSIISFDDGDGSDLYVGGRGFFVGGVLARNIARWDGTTWSTLGGGVSTLAPQPGVNAMAVFDDGTGAALYVGGRFDTAVNAEGVIPTVGIARWDGNEWSAVEGSSGGGLNGFVNALTVFDDGEGPALYAAGYFNLPGGSTRVARWDGVDWSPLPGFSGFGVTEINSLGVFDDGSGPALYAGVSFFTQQITDPGSGILKWAGLKWIALDGGVDAGIEPDDTTSYMAEVTAMTDFTHAAGTGLFVAGGFLRAGDSPSAFIAEWRGCASAPCIADISGDEAIDLVDLNIVLANFGQTTSEGDADGDGFVNKNDLNIVLGAFGTICP